MTLLSSYGSSEYSAEAEELFAEYVRRRAAGQDLDFEAYCQEHPAHADELDGLHADWDNLHGLLGRMGVLGGLAEPAPRPSAGAAGPFVEEPAETLGRAPANDGEDAQRAPSMGRFARPLAAALVLASLTAAASLGWIARREAHAAGELADHNRRLEGQVLARDARLVDLEAARRAAAELAAAETERAERLASQSLAAARRTEELALLAAEEARRAEEALRRADVETERAEEALRHAEAETLRATEQARLAEEGRRRAEAEHQRAEAEHARAEVEARNALEQTLRAGAEARRASDLERERGLAGRRAGAALVALAAERLGRGDRPGARGALDEVEGELRGFAWRHLAARLADAPRVAFEGHRQSDPLELPSLLAMPFGVSGGQMLALVGGTDGLELVFLPLVRREAGAALAGSGWTAAGELAVLGADGRLVVGPPDAGAAPLVLERAELALLEPSLAALSDLALGSGARQALDPAGECLAEIRPGGGLLLRDVASGAVFLEEPCDPPLTRLAFSSDGLHLAAVDEAGRGLVWSLAPERWRARARPSAGRAR